MQLLEPESLGALEHFIAPLLSDQARVEEQRKLRDPRLAEFSSLLWQCVDKLVAEVKNIQEAISFYLI